VDIDVMASRYVAPMRGFSEIQTYMRGSRMSGTVARRTFDNTRLADT
jgi:hypothetical protein